MGPDPAAQPETILVVEDEILIRMLIAGYLRDCGFKVIEAADGDEALVVLQQADVAIDVVFSDVDMPGSLDGFGLAQWVRQNRTGMDVILAGSPARAVNAAADLCTSDPTLSKPYEPQIVLDEIRRLLAARARRVP
jgi:CheY-like chemotaxis protein